MFPETIVRAVCDPRGLPSKSQFLPTLFEIRSACDERMRPLLAAEAQRRRLAEMDADAPAPVSEEAGERRKAFISKWREDVAFMQAERASGTSLAELDARKCKGDFKDRVVEALDDELSRLKADSKASPVVLSERALQAFGNMAFGASS